jgi:hypothetical protein
MERMTTRVVPLFLNGKLAWAALLSGGRLRSMISLGQLRDALS